MQKGKFDLVLWSRSFGPDPECSMVWGSTGPLNFCRLKDAAVDRLLADGRTAPTQELRQACYASLQRYLARQLPWVFIVQPAVVVAHKKEIVNIQKGRQKAAGLKRPKFKQAATPEDVDYRHPRGLDRALFARLMTGRWVREHQNVLLCGPTGIGKTYLACCP